MTTTEPTTTDTGDCFASCEVDAYVLRQALAKVKPAIPRRGTYGPGVPIDHVRISVHAAGSYVSATDLDLDLTAPLRPAFGLGVMLVPFAKLEKLVSKATAKASERVTLDAYPARVVARMGRLSLELEAGDLDAYPRPMVIDDPAGVSMVETAIFGEVLTAASADDARPILTGVCFDHDAIVTTDSYRLHAVTGLADIGDEVNVPAKACRLAARAGDTAVMSWDHRTVTLETDGLTVTARRIIGEYPRWRTLVPSKVERSFTFDREELTAAVGEVSRFLDTLTPVRLVGTHDGAVSVVALQDGEHYQRETDGQYGGEAAPGAPFVVGFNAGYLADLVTGADERVGLGLVDAQKPATLRQLRADGTERLRLIMPVRLS